MPRCPSQLYGGYTVVVQGSIADIPNLNLLIDTGAMSTVVDAGLPASSTSPAIASR